MVKKADTKKKMTVDLEIPRDIQVGLLLCSISRLFDN